MGVIRVARKIYILVRGFNKRRGVRIMHISYLGMAKLGNDL